jgi:ankyrin repeat protein
MMACQNGNAAMTRLLLDAGADPKAPSATGTTPLMLAAAAGNVEAIKTLLDRGAEINAKDKTNGQTALMFAAALNRADAIKVLAQHGAELNVTSTVLEPAAAAGARGAQGTGARPGRPGRGNAVLLGGLSALHFAAREGQLDAVQALVAAGANVNQVTDSDKLSIMTQAIINGHFDIARFLLDHGGDPTLASTGGLTPLFATIDQRWAARTWYPPANTDQEKTTHLELMQAILDRGADPNAVMGPKLWFRQFHGDWVDPTGATAFWRAAQSNDVPAMKLLISRGADPNIATLRKSTPLQAAAGFGLEPQVSNFVPDARLEAIKYLVEELHADVNAKDDSGYTPLHGAALTANNEVILYLVSKGGNVKARANMVFGRGDGGAQDINVAEGTGDTVADMANGPRAHNLVFPETVALLEKLGSANSNDCRASICNIKTAPNKPQQ